MSVSDERAAQDCNIVAPPPPDDDTEGGNNVTKQTQSQSESSVRLKVLEPSGVRADRSPEDQTGPESTPKRGHYCTLKSDRKTEGLGSTRLCSLQRRIYIYFLKKDKFHFYIWINGFASLIKLIFTVSLILWWLKKQLNNSWLTTGCATDTTIRTQRRHQSTPVFPVSDLLLPVGVQTTQENLLFLSSATSAPQTDRQL